MICCGLGPKQNQAKPGGGVPRPRRLTIVLLSQHAKPHALQYVKHFMSSLTSPSTSSQCRAVGGNPKRFCSVPSSTKRCGTFHGMKATAMFGYQDDDYLAPKKVQFMSCHGTTCTTIHYQCCTSLFGVVGVRDPIWEGVCMCGGHGTLLEGPPRRKEHAHVFRWSALCTGRSESRKDVSVITARSWDNIVPMLDLFF